MDMTERDRVEIAARYLDVLAKLIHQRNIDAGWWRGR